MTETNGDTFYVDKDGEVDGAGTSVNDLDLSINSWIMLQDGEQAASRTPGATPRMGTEEAPSAPEPEGKRRSPAGAEVHRDNSDEQV